MYIGVDGGGSKTKVIVLNAEFEQIVFKEYGSLHYMQVGIEGIETIIKDISNYVDDCDTIVIGMPMYGEVAKVDKELDEVVSKYFPQAVIVNDVFNGWAGSLACCDGINVVSGTGTIAICVSDNNSTIVGGFGHVFGDEGSGYWIGRETLSLYSKQLDGRLPKTVLFDLITELEFKNLNFGFDSSRDEIAKYGIICNEAANNGCRYCKDVLVRAANELTLLVQRFSNEYIVSYSGSVFNSEIVKENFISNLNCFKIVEPVLSPVLGSVLYGYVEKYGKADLENIVEKLKVIKC